MNIVEIRRLEGTSDQDDYEVLVKDRDGETHTCYLSIAGSKLATWSDEGIPAGARAASELAQAIVDARRDKPPAEHYYFDTGNCTGTLESTLSQIRSTGDESFIGMPPI